MLDQSHRALLVAHYVGLASVVAGSLVLSDAGYQFANLPKTFSLLCGASVASIALLVLSFGASTSSLPSPVFLLILVSGLQWTRSLNPYEASIPLLVTVGSVGVAYGLAGKAPDETRRRHLSLTLSAVAAVVSLIGVLEHLGVPWGQLKSAGRPSATLGFRNTAATFAAGCIPWCIYLSTRPYKLGRMLGATATIASLLFLLYTRSRGAWAGLAVGAAVWGILYAVRLSRGQAVLPSWKHVSVVACILLLTIGAGTLPAAYQDASLSRLDEKKQSIAQTVRSLSVPGGDRDRLTIWVHTMDMVFDHLVAGVGYGNWSAHYPAYDRGDILHVRSAPRRPHNDFLWVLSEQGIVGFGLLVWVLVAAARRVCRDPDDWQTAAAASATAILVHSLFSFPREQAAPSMLLWIALAVCVGARQGRSRLVPSAQWAVLSIACVIGVVVAARSVQADRLFEGAMVSQMREDFRAQERTASSALALGAFDHRMYLLLGDALYEQHRHQEAADVYREYVERQPHLAAVKNNLGRALNALGDHTAAEAVLQEARAVLPNDRILARTLSEAYRRQGQLDQALSLYRDLATLETEDHQNLGLLYGEADSLELAIDHYRRALQQDPDRYQVVYSIAGILLIQGKLDEAIAQYGAHLDSPDPDPTLVRRSRARLREAYVALSARRAGAGDQDGAVQALEDRVRLGEMEAADYHTLALGYGRAGRFGRAEDAARMALRLDGGMTIARLTLANALFEQKKPEAFRHYAAFVETWEGDPKPLQLAQDRLRRAKQ